MRIHGKTEHRRVMAVKNAGDVQFDIFGFDFRNIRDAFRARFVGVKIAFNPIVGLPRVAFSFCNDVGFSPLREPYPDAGHCLLNRSRAWDASPRRQVLLQSHFYFFLYGVIRHMPDLRSSFSLGLSLMLRRMQPGSAVRRFLSLISPCEISSNCDNSCGQMPSQRSLLSKFMIVCLCFVGVKRQEFRRRRQADKTGMPPPAAER